MTCKTSASRASRQQGPGPTYSADKAQTMLANRYEFFPRVMRRSLPRLQADSGFRALVHELREEGWLDWHVLTGAYGIVLNVRLAAKGLNTREVVLDPRQRAETRRLAFEPETDQDPEVSLDLFTREGVDRGRAVALLSLVQHWDLECRQRTPDVPAIEQLLAERYGYWTDDIYHPEPFPDQDGMSQQGAPAA